MSEPFTTPGADDPVVVRSAAPSVLRGETIVDEPAARTTAFVPLLLLGLALLAWFVFQAIQATADREVIRAAATGQDRQLDESKKLRSAFETLYRGTLQLADGGNQNARLVADELKRRGVGLNGQGTPPPGATTTPTAPPGK